MKPGAGDTWWISGNKIMIRYEGLTLHVSAWARRLGLRQPTISKRLKAGKPLGEVLHHGAVSRKVTLMAQVRNQQEEIKALRSRLASLEIQSQRSN